jgi:hypothetical protein
MKLSEAIRLGSYATEKGVGSAAMWGEKRCALGAALFAIGDRDSASSEQETIREVWPWTQETIVSPVTTCPERIMDIIWILNDVWGWTRERIADWVATVEPRENEFEEIVGVLAEPREFDHEDWAELQYTR